MVKAYARGWDIGLKTSDFVVRTLLTVVLLSEDMRMRRSSKLLLVVLTVLLVAPTLALAAVSVKRASLSASGALSVEGRGALASATITVTSPESTATGKANSKGEFKFSAAGFRSSTCKATVGDGSTSATVTLSGCTPAATPPPPPPPPPSSATAPTSLSLSHTSLGAVNDLAVAGVAFPANPTVPLDFAVQSSHPANAQVPASVHVDNFSDPANPVASFTVTYAAAVSAATVVTISVSAAGVTRTATLTLNPPQAPFIGPDQPELGPGFVGSDFTTFSTLGTTMTFSPGTAGPVQWEIVAGALPDGLRLITPSPDSTSIRQIYQAVAGTPTTVQTSTFTIKATDVNGLTAQRTYTIRINPAQTVSIVPQQWAPLTVGNFNNLWIDGTGGVRPYRWAVTAGQLPPGMTLIQDNASGPLVRVSGTPTTAGTFNWTLRLTDAQNATVSRNLSVTVG
jgi:hypothetical protein